MHEEIKNQVYVLKWKIMNLAHRMCTTIKGQNVCLAAYNMRFKEESEVKLLKYKIAKIKERMNNKIEGEQEFLVENLKLSQEKLASKSKCANEKAWLGAAWYCLARVKKEHEENVKLNIHYITSASRAHEIASGKYTEILSFKNNVNKKGREEKINKTKKRHEKICALAKKMQPKTCKKLTPNTTANRIRERWPVLINKDSSMRDLFGEKIPSNKNIRIILGKNKNSW